MEPVYFESRAAFRAWLEANHRDVSELWVGFYKKASGKPTVTYVEAVEESLCFGWIDGVRYTVDAERFRQRFTPRRQGSNWSAINVKRVEALTAAGLMAPAGIAAFEARDTGGAPYSDEWGEVRLGPEYEAALAQHPEALSFFRDQPPWYQRISASWVMGAKQEQTRLRRLERLIADSEAGEWIGPLRTGRSRRRDSSGN